MSFIHKLIEVLDKRWTSASELRAKSGSSELTEKLMQ
jgi:hypothetical protein